MTLIKEDIRRLLDIIITASHITEWFRVNDIIKYEKADKSPVTLADYASQYYIIMKLKELFSDDKIIAEESNSADLTNQSINLINRCFLRLDLPEVKKFGNIINYRGGESNRIWTIDPVDGTKGFIENSWYAIGISLLIENQVELSIISIPNYNGVRKIFKALQGKGAQVSTNGMNFSPLKVSKTNRLSESKICHSLHHDQEITKKFIEVTHIRESKPMDSMAKFCTIASGKYDLYFRPILNYVPKIWDYAPGDLIVREAGGEVTDLNGSPLVYREGRLILPTPGLLTSNGFLHNQSLKIINSLLD